MLRSLLHVSVVQTPVNRSPSGEFCKRNPQIPSVNLAHYFYKYNIFFQTSMYLKKSLWKTVLKFMLSSKELDSMNLRIVPHRLQDLPKTFGPSQAVNQTLGSSRMFFDNFRHKANWKWRAYVELWTGAAGQSCANMRAHPAETGFVDLTSSPRAVLTEPGQPHARCSASINRIYTDYCLCVYWLPTHVFLGAPEWNPSEGRVAFEPPLCVLAGCGVNYTLLSAQLI